MRGTPGGSQLNVGSIVITPVVFNSAVLASNRACASGSNAGGFPMECRPPPNPPDHWPDRSRGSNADWLFAALDGGVFWAIDTRAQATAIARHAIHSRKCFCRFIGISLMAPRSTE